MNAESMREFLLWCLIINYGVLLSWFAAFRFGHRWMFTLHSRWFHLSEERFDGIHYLGMALYKIAQPRAANGRGDWSQLSSRPRLPHGSRQTPRFRFARFHMTS
jgi:Family of unknown function (DUF6868)